MAHIHKKFELNRTKIKEAIRKIIGQTTNKQKKAGPRRLVLAQPQKVRFYKVNT